MIDTIIFDLGGVLVDFHPEQGMRDMGFSEEAIKAFNTHIFSGFWEECDKMTYSNEEIRKAFKEKLPEYTDEVDILWDNLPAITGLRPYAMEWIRDLKAKGFKLYVLSNFGNISFEINSKGYDFLPMMDGKVISYEIGIVKPDIRIYDELIKRFNIIPGNAVFIDDRQINVDGAIRAGMHGILFESYDITKNKLEKLCTPTKMKLEVGRPLNTAGRLEKEIRTYDLLDSLGIRYERADHEALKTMEACVEVDKVLAPAVICKNLLLCNSKETDFYLLMIKGDKKFNTREISQQIHSTRLSFAPAKYMEEFLDILPGSVSVLGLMNDKDCKVKLLVDEDVIKAEYLGCHPCINTSSLRIKTSDVFTTFLQAVGHEYVVVKAS